MAETTDYHGSKALKIEKKADGFVATEVWSGVSSYQYNTPVLKDDLLFGLSSDKKFFCMDAKTGKVLWTDKTPRGEAGGVLTGEHGVGIEKRDLMPLLFSPDDLDAQARLRDAFDPDGVANPLKVLPRGSRCGELQRVPDGAWI